MSGVLKGMLKEIIGDKNIEKIKMSKLKSNNRVLYNKICDNSNYKNTHLGKRCFILGNGPSLRNVDLADLSDEFVFTVNNFSQVNNYKAIKTNVHLWMDFSFFGMREDQKYDMTSLMKNYQDIAQEHPICFFPQEAYDFVNQNKLHEILNVNYLITSQNVSENKPIFCDIAQPITAFTTVVQYAILIAIYMGFSEIYLLGCDTTNIVSVINCALEMQNSQMHAYDNDDTEERYKELLKHWTMTDVFRDQYLLFLGYKKLAEFAKNKNIKLVNCSSQTLINEIVREDLHKILM